MRCKFNRLLAFDSSHRGMTKAQLGKYLAARGITPKGECTDRSHEADILESCSVTWYTGAGTRKADQIAKVHYYIRKDGRIGRSELSLPDPFVISHKGVRYRKALTNENWYPSSLRPKGKYRYILERIREWRCAILGW